MIFDEVTPGIEKKQKPSLSLDKDSDFGEHPQRNKKYISVERGRFKPFNSRIEAG
jgi:hypothetical protein